MLAGSTMNTFGEPLENIFRMNKREGQESVSGFIDVW